MKSLTSLLLLSTSTSLAIAQSTTTSFGAAPLATDQPSRRTYQAILQISKVVQGSITGVSSDNGLGVDFNINFHEFPDVAAAGPFAYHIHVNPVTGGNCTTAGGHLMPFNGPPDNFTCPGVPNNVSVCQVGDLSGKHGKITAEKLENGKFMAMYNDEYVSAIEGSAAFFGNRSVVVHAANGTRINCANFVMMDGPPSEPTTTTNIPAPPTGNPSATVTPSGASGTASPTKPSPSPIQSVSGASGMLAHSISWAGMALLGVAAAAVAAV